MSIDRIDRFIRDIEEIKYYSYVKERNGELAAVVASLKISLAASEKERDELRALVPDVPRNKQMWKSMIEDTLQQLAKPEPRSFHPTSVELGIPNKISKFIDSQVNIRLDEQFHLRLKEEFRRQTLRAIETLEKNWPADRLGEMTEEKVQQLKLKAEAHPLQALHRCWELKCSFCKTKLYVTLDDDKIKDLITKSYIEQDHWGLGFPHKVIVNLVEILHEYLASKSK